MADLQSPRQRDGRTLLLVAGAFLVMLLIAGPVSEHARATHDVELARGLEALCVVSFSAVLVLGFWGVVLACRPVARDGARASLAFLKRLRWKMPQRNMLRHLALALLGAGLIHLFFLWLCNVSVQYDTQFIKGSGYYNIQLPGALRRDRAAHFVIQSTVGSPYYISVSDIKSGNWYELETQRRVSEFSSSELAKLGWTLDGIRQKIAEIYEELPRLEKTAPGTELELQNAIKPFADLSIPATTPLTSTVTLNVFGVPQLWHDFDASNHAPLRLYTDGQRIWMLQHYGWRLMSFFDAKNRYWASVWLFPNNDERSFFYSLSACLAAIVLAWLALLAPFFYLRLEPKTAAAGDKSTLGIR